MFFFSRFFIELLSPLNLSIICFLLALILLVFHGKKSSGFFLVFGLCLLLACGYGIGAKDEIASKERIYTPLDGKKIVEYRAQGIRYIAVLGSGHVSDPRLPVTSQIGSSSLFRLVEGVRLHNALENSTLIILGGVGYDSVPNARVVAEVAGNIGVDLADIIIKDLPRDTLQEAEVVRETVGELPFVLVTSAYHMPRAMEIFEDAGLHPIPAPTDYIIKEYKSASPADILPNAGNLSLSQQVVYEKLGYLWKLVKTNITNYQL